MTFNRRVRRIQSKIEFIGNGRALRVGAACALVALGGCQTPSADPAFATDFKRVGVVSVTAAALTVHAPGANAYDDTRSVKDITAWAVDRAYEEQMAAAVQSIAGATAVRGTAPPADLARMNDPATPFVQPGFWSYPADPTAASIRAYCARNQMDALVVASASIDDDVLGGTYHAIAGAGVYAHDGNHLLYLSTALTLIDCETGRPLARHRVASGRSFAASHGYPVRDLAQAPAAGAAWTPQDDQRIEQALIALPAQAWADTLQGMLHPDVPPIFGRTMLPGT
jgi:hypothetical protein